MPATAEDLQRYDAATAHLEPPFAVVDLAALRANAAGMTAPVTNFLDWARYSVDLERPIIIGLFLVASILLLPGFALFSAGVISRWLGRVQGSARPLIADFAMTLAPLGFAMWLAHLVFHLFTGSHTPIPVIQRIAADLHLAVRNRDGRGAQAREHVGLAG